MSAALSIGVVTGNGRSQMYVVCHTRPYPAVSQCLWAEKEEIFIFQHANYGWWWVVHY